MDQIVLSSIPTPTDGQLRKRKVVRLEDDIFDRHRTTRDEVVLYFNKLIGLVGCRKDPHIVCRGWELVCRALAVASKSNERDIASLKTVVCACLSLAIEVSAEFEADYVVSSAAWGYLLFSQVTERESGISETDVKDSCSKLMALKLLIASSLDWQLGSPSVAEIFASYTNVLLQNSAHKIDCEVCCCMRKDIYKVWSHASCILRSLTCGLLLPTEKESAEVIAIMSIIVLHETFLSRQASKTCPLNRVKRSLRVTRAGIEGNGLGACILEMAERCLYTAAPLLQARDLLLCRETAASIVELDNQSEAAVPIPILRKLDSLVQSGSPSPY